MTRHKKIKKSACKKCPAVCCEDLAIDIKRPRTKGDVEELKWQLMFDTVWIFIRNRRWHLHIQGRCIYLDKNNLCTIYDKRPDTCRKHNPPECERFGAFYDTMIKTPERLERYMHKEKRDKKKKRKK